MALYESKGVLLRKKKAVCETKGKGALILGSKRVILEVFWSRKMTGVEDVPTAFLLYALTVLPFLPFHFILSDVRKKALPHAPFKNARFQADPSCSCAPVFRHDGKSQVTDL